jgi:riboflavin biosynthesis pyrimidine reductase
MLYNVHQEQKTNQEQEAKDGYWVIFFVNSAIRLWNRLLVEILGTLTCKQILLEGGLRE